MSVDPYLKSSNKKKWAFMTAKNKENILDKDVFFNDSIRFQKNHTQNHVYDFSKGSLPNSLFLIKIYTFLQKKSIFYQKNNFLERLDLLDQEIHSYSNKIKKLQNLKETKNPSKFALFNPMANTNQKSAKLNSLKYKQNLPSRNTDNYQQYKELKLFKQLSTQDIANPNEAIYTSTTGQRNLREDNTLRNVASQNILGNSSFVRSNNLGGIQLDQTHSYIVPKKNENNYNQSSKRVRFDPSVNKNNLIAEQTWSNSMNRTSSLPNKHFMDKMERKQQTSHIQFVGTGTTKDEDQRHWKLQNQKKHLKYQQDLLEQIHQKRNLKNKKPSARGPHLRKGPKKSTFNLPNSNNEADLQNNYFQDLPNAITDKVKSGMEDMLDSLKQGIKSNNKKMENEADHLKKLSLELLHRRKNNEDEIAKLRKRLADSHYKNLVHKENVLGIFAQGCTGLFGNYYLPNVNCNLHSCQACTVTKQPNSCICKQNNFCDLLWSDNNRVCLDSTNKKYCNRYDADFYSFRSSKSKPNLYQASLGKQDNLERKKEDLEFINENFKYAIESCTGHKMDYINEGAPICMSKMCRIPYDSVHLPNDLPTNNIHQDLTSLVPIMEKTIKRQKGRKNSKKIKDLLRLHRNPSLKNKIYARPKAKIKAWNLMNSKNINPDEILEFSKKGDTETLLKGNNLYLDYLLNSKSTRLISEAKYVGDNDRLFF